MSVMTWATQQEMPGWVKNKNEKTFFVLVWRLGESSTQCVMLHALCCDEVKWIYTIFWWNRFIAVALIYTTTPPKIKAAHHQKLNLKVCIL